MRFQMCVAAGLTLFSLAACEDGSKPEDLSAKVYALEVENQDLKRQLAELSTKQLMSDWDHIAHLTPGDTGYSVVKFDLGSITVRMSDIQPYANGSKVTLVFGNLTSAHINGVKANIEWGKSTKDGTPDNSTIKSREISFAETLRPAAWNTVNVVLEGVPPQDLGFVRLKNIRHEGIRLSSSLP